MSKGKKKIKNTKFGKRALSTAKRGGATIKNRSGTSSSVRTATFDIPGKKKGATDVALTATIRKRGDSLRQLSPQEAIREALATGDFVRIKGGKTEKSVERARKKGDKKSRKFSKKLGRISKRRGR